jgi:hypothetical protein
MIYSTCVLLSLTYCQLFHVLGQHNRALLCSGLEKLCLCTTCDEENEGNAKKKLKVLAYLRLKETFDSLFHIMADGLYQLELTRL